MRIQPLDVVLFVAFAAVFTVGYAVAAVRTRPARVQPDPATPDLGEEPPAVVNLLANRWRLTCDAAESTLLDLAARRFIELRQLGDDPYDTTIHLPADLDRRPTGSLRPYERRVLHRIRKLAVGGVVPVTALTFRNDEDAKRWQKHFRREVIDDARRLGLSRRRFSTSVVSTLTTLAFVTAAGVAVILFRVLSRSEDADPPAALGIGVAVFVGLSGLVNRAGERDTPAGRRAAARWLAVRDWLRGHEEFAALPPAAVAVWDRYLPYGAALGVTHTASAVLDLGLGDRRLLWSSYGDRWRRVRVRYPRVWRRYGLSVPRLLLRAGAALVVGLVLVLVHRTPVHFAESESLSAETVERMRTVQWGLLAAGAVLLAYGLYVAVRSLVDLATTRVVTGEVLWVELWRSRPGDRNRPPQPWLDYLAVDDGTSDRTTAWGLPRALGVSCRDGDRVRLTVRPWSRRVVELALLERRHWTSHVPDPADFEPLSPWRQRPGSGDVQARG